MDEDIPPAPDKVPHYGTIIAVTFFVLIGFAGVSAYILAYGNDNTIRGSIIATWNNLAVAAGAFWLGSSLGGKMKK